MKVKIKVKTDKGECKEPDADDTPKRVMKKAADLLKVASKKPMSKRVSK